MRIVVLTAGLLALASNGQAQEWSANTFDTGALVHGAAIAPGGTFALSCTAPSPQGLPLIETGDHESLRTDTPYGLAISFTIDLIDPSASQDFDLPSPQMILDGEAFALPPMEYSDFYGAWTGITHFDAPGILELFLATELVVSPDQDTTIDFTVSGLSAALDAGLSPCLERWFELGNPLPPRVLQYVATQTIDDVPPAPAPASTSGASGLPEVSFAPPDLDFRAGEEMGLRAIRSATAACGGTASFHDGAFDYADYDSDGIEDVTLYWSLVQCGDGQPPQGICDTFGNCAVSAFVSGDVAAGHRDWMGAMLAMTAHAGALPHTNQSPFAYSTHSGSICIEQGLPSICAGLLRWVGPGFQPVVFDTGEGQAIYDAIQRDAMPDVAPQPTSQAAATPTGLSPAPLFDLPQTPPAAIFEHLTALCEGAFDITDLSAITGSDLDGDGAADYVINYTALVCNGGLSGRAFCGAANCSIDVFLSSQDYRSPEQFLGFDLQPVQDAQGRIGLLLSGTPFICADGFCDTPFYWDGTTFTQ